jgi:hypothetical protein
MWMIQMLPRADAVKDLKKFLTSLDCSKPSRLHPIGEIEGGQACKTAALRRRQLPRHRGSHSYAL